MNYLPTTLIMANKTMLTIEDRKISPAVINYSKQILLDTEIVNVII